MFQGSQYKAEEFIDRQNVIGNKSDARTRPAVKIKSIQSHLSHHRLSRAIRQRRITEEPGFS
jgi:hypothetical protein